ncbi:MAG: Long-chain-fatty-acid--CoA ligase FadD15 [Ignavibacteria bacterium]|nr:Long-chain-fatty-acid--CoA ligase FadD15 [Ignavibacteria bacterium]
MNNTLTDYFLELINDYGFNKNAFFTKEDEEYIPFSYSDLAKNLICLMKYFISNDIYPGDKVSILSENRTEWVTVDFACMFYKAVSVPLYTSTSENQIRYILENSESKICFVSNSFLAEKILKMKKDLPSLRIVSVFNNISKDEDYYKSISLFGDILKNKTNSDENEILSELIKLSESVKENDLLTIIYTSGTTGNPKGVMLSHKNIYSNVKACKKVLPISDKDRFLSYLPYSHIYERTAGYYLALFSGAEVYYAQNIETISAQLPEVKPTIVITVPRLLDKIYNRLMKSSDTIKNPFKKILFNQAINLANNSTDKSSFKWKLFDRLVYKKIREKTGGEIRFFVSGGGALNSHIGRFFENTGLTTLEGYGLTETSPVISVNPPEMNKYGTVGKAIDGVEIRLSDDNEILVKGDLVMQGYYKDEKATGESIKDGWLYTGDIGIIDDEGYLKITDRKKSLFKTSGGKYIAPVLIEDLLCSLDFVETVVAIGNERMFVTALIVPFENELIEYSRKQNINFKTYEELLTDPKLHQLIQRDIDIKQSSLAHFERVRRFTLLPKPFSIESGELTPTLKVKRKFVEEKYSDEIEKMYLKL